MRVLHWTKVGLTSLLLLSEVVISQLCTSPIALLDSFHTLFILLNVLYLPLRQTFIGGHVSSADLQGSPTQTSSTYHICSVHYRDMRTQLVGAFISDLVLLSLNVIYLTEISGFVMDPVPARRPLLLVVIGSVSLFFKMSLLGLHWDQGQCHRESHIEVNHKALDEEERVQVEQGAVLKNTGALYNTALSISNPNTLSVPEDKKEHYKNGTCVQHCNNASIVTISPNQPEDYPVPNQLPWFLIFEHLLTPFLVLVNSLVTLGFSSMCSHNSQSLCNLLLYMDPVLSLLAAVMLLAKATPEVFRYGLLLLQATPSHLSVAELGKMIMDVPGVVSMHELHVWKLSDSFTVASVHVHCNTCQRDSDRCLEVMLGVTTVLQRVGVNCCTVQPECACYSTPSAAKETSSQLCSLACGKACAGSMCCSQLEEQYRTLAAHPTGTTKEEPHAGTDH